MNVLQPGQLAPVDADRLTAMCQEASASPRRRAHILLHADHRDQVQRLLIAVEPDSSVRAHRHSEQWEMLVLLQGQLDVLSLSDEGQVRQRVELTPASPVVHIPMGLPHCAVARASGTVVMEVKPGPYTVRIECN